MPSDDYYRELIRQLLPEYGGSYSRLGDVLARTISPTHRGFSRQYVYRLLNAESRITDEIRTALDTLAALADEVSPLQARTRPVQVYAAPDVPAGAFVLGHAKSCGLAGCLVVFVPVVPSQKYCSPECSREAAKRRRAEQRKAEHKSD